jgi:NAD(P)-dependent dehydrogenase (short-subunit alcohol dehydrogenase family)
MLSDKTALVTGSSRGIGKAVALSLAASGANIVVNYVTQERDAQDVVSQIHALGSRAIAVRADVSRPDQLQALFTRVEQEWGSLDIYINNAIDVAAFGPIARMKVEPWRHTIESHATTLLLAAQCAARLMRGRSGVIVTLSSLGSHRCFDGYAAVGVGKAAVEALTRYLAVEFGPLGIRVNAVSAGPIDTDALRGSHNIAVIEETSCRLPSGRIGTPEDVAGVVAFLCSDEARWMYGQTLIADGGLSILSPYAFVGPTRAGASSRVADESAHGRRTTLGSKGGEHHGREQ